MPLDGVKDRLDDGLRGRLGREQQEAFKMPAQRRLRMVVALVTLSMPAAAVIVTIPPSNKRSGEPREACHRRGFVGRLRENCQRLHVGSCSGPVADVEPFIGVRRDFILPKFATDGRRGLGRRVLVPAFTVWKFFVLTP